MIKQLEEYLPILQYKKQVILQGPPGTGKTYTAKELAEQLIFGNVHPDKAIQQKRLANSEQFALIQFHPSYTYEDFVRGIVTEQSEDEQQLSYVTKNKIFAEFAEKAFHNLQNSNKENENALSRRILYQELLLAFADYIQEMIDSEGKFPLGKTVVSLMSVEADAFRYTGDNWAVKRHHRMKFDDLLEAYLEGITERQGIKKSTKLSGLARQHASYYIRVLDLFRDWLTDKKIEKNKYKSAAESKKNFVLIIDEINRANLPTVLGELIYALEYRGDEVDAMYAVDGQKGLVIPENLFIIGTMNTADRSVGQIDYAIRRRFAFINVLPSAEILQGKSKTLFEAVSQLFHEEYLAPDFQASEVQLGHSYFLAKDDHELALRLKAEIIPILAEYVKDGILLDHARDTIKKLRLDGK